MKYCVSCRQPSSILKLADEIRIPYSDVNKTIDLAKEFPDKTFIIEIERIDAPWNLFEAVVETYDIIFCTSNFEIAQEIKKHNLKFFWGFPISNWYEFQSVIAYEPCYVYVTDTLYFDLEKVKAYNIPIRLCANKAYNDFIPRKNGVEGTWIRPEDVQLYEKYADALEFNTKNNLAQEATLLKIYKVDKKWEGNLNFIISNLNINIDNRGIPSDFGEKRMNCAQKCMRIKNSCHSCETAFRYSSALRNEYYRRLNPEGITLKDKIKVIEEFMSERGK